MNKTKLSFYIFINFETWFQYTRRPHLAELSKFGELNIIESPLAILSEEFLTNIFKSFFLYFKYSFRLRKDERCGAAIIRPLLLFPITLRNKYPSIRKIDLLILNLQIKRFHSRDKDSLKVHLLTDKAYGWLIQKKENTYYILDMNDEWSMISYNNAKRYQIEAVVRDLINKVDLVTAVTIELKEKYNVKNKVYYLPNGVDVSHYVPDFDATSKRIPENSVYQNLGTAILKSRKNNPRLYRTNLNALEKISKPIAGSISGFGGNWSDFGFMAEVEILLPKNITLLSSGNIHPPSLSEFLEGYEKYIQNQRMIFLEYLDYSVLPDFLKYLDVGIVMHRMDEFNKHSAPNKIWAYLAMGLPVVSTDFLNDYDKYIFEGLVKFAKTPSEYVEYIIKSIEEDSSELKMKRRELAKKHSTRKRAEKLFNLITSKESNVDQVSNEQFISLYR